MMSDLSVSRALAAPPEVLVVSGLSPIETDPWQAWLATRLPEAAWVRPLDGDWPDLDRWAQRIERAVSGWRRARPWIVLAHGFGALAVVHHAMHGQRSPAAAILLAPALPHRFGQNEASLGHALPFPSTLVALQGGAHAVSPWMQDADAERWARAWGSTLVDAGGGPPADARTPWPEAEALLAGHGLPGPAGAMHMQSRIASLSR